MCNFNVDFLKFILGQSPRPTWAMAPLPGPHPLGARTCLADINFALIFKVFSEGHSLQTLKLGRRYGAPPKTPPPSAPHSEARGL